MHFGSAKILENALITNKSLTLLLLIIIICLYLLLLRIKNNKKILKAFIIYFLPTNPIKNMDSVYFILKTCTEHSTYKLLTDQIENYCTGNKEGKAYIYICI